MNRKLGLLELTDGIEDSGRPLKVVRIHEPQIEKQFIFENLAYDDSAMNL
jgi:hypothetical protein